jgi:hypothetical protein
MSDEGSSRELHQGSVVDAQDRAPSVRKAADAVIAAWRKGEPLSKHLTTLMNAISEEAEASRQRAIRNRGRSQVRIAKSDGVLVLKGEQLHYHDGDAKQSSTTER